MGQKWTILKNIERIHNCFAYSLSKQENNVVALANELLVILNRFGDKLNPEDRGYLLSLLDQIKQLHEDIVAAKSMYKEAISLLSQHFDLIRRFADTPHQNYTVRDLKAFLDGMDDNQYIDLNFLLALKM